MQPACTDTHTHTHTHKLITHRFTCQIFQTGNSNVTVLNNDICPEGVHFDVGIGLGIPMDEERAPEVRQQVINFPLRDQGAVLKKSGKYNS